MNTIFSSLQKPGSWQQAQSPPKSIIKKSCLYTLKSKTALEKANFIMTKSSLYSLDNNGAPTHKLSLKWKTFEPFYEEDGLEERFGFQILSSESSMDFYTESQDALEEWLEALAKVCICKDFEDDFLLLKQLGIGGSSVVYLAKSTQNLNHYSVKSFFKTRNRLEELAREITILKSLDNPNVVKLHRVYETRNHIHMVMDYVSKTDLYKLVVHHGKLPEEQVARLIKECLRTISYIHSKGVIHRDIKLENVLLEESKLKLIDFGMSAFETDCFKLCGSPGYIAPEILAGKPYGPKADIFSTGVVVYALLSGVMPFCGSSEAEVMLKNKECRVEFLHENWVGVSQEAKDLVTQLTKSDSDERASAEEALLHPWFSEMLKSD